MNKQPNIIICTCDQLRAFEVGCYGNKIIHTPHVDRLASEGTRFETAVTNYPVCMAARSVLISGQYNRTCTGGIGNVHYSTIVLFTSDHGDNLGSHGLVQKGGPNEESIRIPFVVRCPSLIPESTTETNRVASLVDIAPTLLSLSGIPIPSHY